jgi:hypothetical protein
MKPNAGPKPKMIDEIVEDFDANKLQHIVTLLDELAIKNVRHFKHPSGLEIIRFPRGSSGYGEGGEG